MAEFIKPSFEIILQDDKDAVGYQRHIERIGRLCYKSGDKITEQSYEGFVDRMIKSKHCYTGNSQVLTEKGWISWNAYDGEKVAVVNNSGYYIGFETPIRVIKHSYTGNFYYYPSLGLEVTDGHRMYGLFRESKNDFYNSNLYGTFVCGSPYKDNNGRKKTLGERMFKVPKHCNIPIYTNPFYELVGFWLGDGCYQPQTINKLVFHLKKDRKIKYLQGLCNELGYTLEKGKSNYYKVCSPQIGAKFTNLFYNNGKYIPNMYMAESPVAIRSIILGLINSDGSIGVNTKTITFTTTSWSIIQWIDNVAAIGGFTTSFRGICHETPKHNPAYKILILDTDYTINNDSRNPDSKVRITKKTEDVYCVTVSTGLIIVKGDNGVTSICGNCAMLEHGTIYLKFPIENGLILGHYLHNNYSKCVISNNTAYITTNYRVIVENKYQDDLQYQCEPTEYHERRYSVKFTMDRIGSQSVCRHRVFSFAQESTRFCNYSKDKFGSHVKISVPSWIEETNYSEEKQAKMEARIEEIIRPKTFWEKIKSLFKKEKYLDKDATDADWWLLANMMSEKAYMNLTETYKWSAQQARSVLPCDLNTEIVMTGFASDWIHFFNLRSLGLTGAPHPDIKVIADELKEEFIKRGFILENQLGKE